jgi:hypothetical protein
MLGFLQVLEPFGQVVPILHGKRDQERFQIWILSLDHLEPGQIRSQSFRPSTNRAERAKKVFFAEMGGVQPHLVYGEKVVEKKVRAALIHPIRNHLMLASGTHILGHIEAG